MSSKEKICAVVVTYNRKQLLIECLAALLKQTRSLDAIYIIDNFSNDGTEELLLENGFLSELPPSRISNPYESELFYDTSGLLNSANYMTEEKGQVSRNLKIKYIRMHENTGGAGGFHQGVKKAHEDGYDWVWLMDDDGVPEIECLFNLVAYSDRANYLAPLVVDITNSSRLSFSLNGGVNTVENASAMAIDGVIKNVANPFNGILISKKLTEYIGYPKKEMFIWGDEIEHLYRALESKLGVLTVISAIHYHPKGRVERKKIPYTQFSINLQESSLKNYCDIRNRAYILWRYNKRQLLKEVVKYHMYYIFKMDLSGYIFYIKAMFDGLFKKWGGERKYFVK